MTDKNKKTSSQYYNKLLVEPCKHNPFATELCQTIKLGKKITGFVNSTVGVYNDATGERIDTGSVIGRRELVDKEEFIKFFGAGILTTFELPKAARDVFYKIAHAYLEQDTSKRGKMDKIYFNYLVAVEDYGYEKTDTTFNNGLNALINAGFFAHIEGRDGWLWINNNLMAKGDRVVLYKEYLVEGSETHKAIMAEEAAKAAEMNAYEVAEDALRAISESTQQGALATAAAKGINTETGEYTPPVPEGESYLEHRNKEIAAGNLEPENIPEEFKPENYKLEQEQDGTSRTHRIGEMPKGDPANIFDVEGL